MEYTDAPEAEALQTVRCPECGHEVAPNAQRCDACGTALEPQDTAEGKASDAFAVVLSILPGLGHIYKGYTLPGLLLLFVATPMAIGVALLAATATAGFAILLLPLYWFAVMFHVYSIKDRVDSTKADLGEQY